MRLLGILTGFLILLFIRAEFQHAGNEIAPEQNSPPIVPSAPPAATVDTPDINPVTPALQSDARQYEQIAMQSGIDRQTQQIQATQDRALQASRR